MRHSADCQSCNTFFYKTNMSQRNAAKPEQGYYIREDRSLSWRTSRQGRKKMFRRIEKDREKAIGKKKIKMAKVGNGQRKRTSVVYGQLRLKETCAGKKKLEVCIISLQESDIFQVVQCGKVSIHRNYLNQEQWPLRTIMKPDQMRVC